MYEKVTKYIQDRIHIPLEELERSFSYSTLQTFKKGDYIIRIGEYCGFIGFINSGMIVCTIIDESGKETACGFCFENCFFTYTEGMMNNQPSHKNFIALEDCEMLVLGKEKLPLIFASNPKFESLFAKIVTEDLRNVMLREQKNRTLSAKSRYLEFLAAHPNAFNRIPLKYIAGYLGIEPQSLSRLRKRLSQRSGT
jgi:CRP/FNR family transcriptional regulator, anaerobic regulatory protein